VGSAAPVSPSYYADFNGLEGLKTHVKADDPQAIREAARQFESLYTAMMLKAMRDAKLGDSLGESQSSEVYQDMYDQQLAVQMSKGKGLGLADMLVQQLTRHGLIGKKAAAGLESAPGATSSQPASTATAPSATAPSPAQRIGFVQAITPYAQQAAQALGVSSDTIIAHAALETGWGQRVPATGSGSSNNLFGIKASGSWGGAVASASTTEYQQGRAANTVQGFRAYRSLQQGVADYVAVLQGSTRYSAALGTGDDAQAFGTALQRGGYATDPAYAQKLTATVASVRSLRAAAPALKLYAALPIASGGDSA
jgi:peptidoglycan hydrolase FlgJ